MTLDATQALDRLREGNRRFVSNQAAGHVVSDPTRRAELVAGQEPFAIILGCSDSRVPAELVFDQGFGDLFVIRVAGNIVAPSQVGSVEFATMLGQSDGRHQPARQQRQRDLQVHDGVNRRSRNHPQCRRLCWNDQKGRFPVL